MTLLSTFISLLIFSPFPSLSFPLSTSSRWIVDKTSGRRVKLACVNWPGHLNPMVPEGLSKRPIKSIVSDISSRMGFNCVRFTWATYMYTRNPNVTVSESLNRWNLSVARQGVEKNNPEVLGMSVVDAHQAVVNELGKQNLMVVLDNHVSLPGWCCGDDDGNGFFGDQYFDTDEWVRGLAAVARRYKGNPTVVGISMRNELRGPRQNQTDWYKYMQQGGSAIHGENPDILVIFSGLSYDTNLGFLKGQPLSIDLDQKLVFESHWYKFGQPVDKWIFQTNDYCARATKSFMDNSGFLFADEKKPVPVFLSEFGIDQSGKNEDQNRYLICLLATVAEHDVDWALWQLPGSYMLRQGKMEMEDLYGMYDFSWENLRNSTMLQRLQFVQRKIQDPMNQNVSYIMYHPESGQCVVANDTVYMTNCGSASQWLHKQDGGPIQSSDTSQNLILIGVGQPPLMSSNSSGPRSLWTAVSVSKHHLAAKDENGKNYCLEMDYKTSKVVTNKCLCLGDDLSDVPRCEENPQKQWFKLIPNTMMSKNN